MSTTTVVLQGGMTAAVSATLDAGADVMFVDLMGRNVNASQIMLGAGTDGLVNFRGFDEDAMTSMKFASKVWHTGQKIGFISHTGTDASLGILVRK